MTWSDNFSTLFELLPIGAYRTDATSRQVRANRAMVRIFGFETEEEMLSTTKSRAEGWYVDPGRRAQFRALLEANGSVRDFVSEMRRDGSAETFWISENAHLVRDAEGKVLYHEGTIEDITGRVRAQQALQLTLDNAGRGIAHVDAEGTLVLYNRQLAELLDLPEPLLAGRPKMRDVIAFQEARGDFADDDLQLDAQARMAFELEGDHYASGEPAPSQRYLRRTRAGLVLEVAMERLPGGGQVRTYSDVTAYVNAQSELARRQAELSALVGNIPDRVWLKDAAGVFRLSNTAHARQHGLRTGEIVGRTAEEIFGAEEGARQRASDLQAMASDQPVAYEHRVFIDGAWRDAEVVKVAMRNERGECIGLLGIARDITSRKESEAALIAAKEAAESAERVKADFLANMSHEIRTPMNAVIGMGELLLATPLSTRQRELAETMRTSSDALLSLINDILDFSKIESGHLELEQVPVDLAACIEAALDISSGPAAARGLDLMYWIDDGVPQQVLGDGTRLRQVFVNLVSNAVKFTQRGEVVVTLSLRKSPDGSPMLHASVRDTGMGIPADRQALLFQAFSQVDASITRRFGGTGLGLAICRRLVALMGGRIWVESREGEGSDFQFEVPCVDAGAPAAWPAEDRMASLAGQRILIVDDNASSRDHLARQAQRWGMTATAAAWPGALERVAAGEAFDVVMVDAHMPGMEGHALVSELRAQPAFERTPIVMLAPLGTPVDPLPAVRVLTKPVKARAYLEALVEALVEALDPSFAERAVAQEAPATSLPLGRELPLRVLLAEDNALNQRVATLILEGLGYAAHMVANGQLALDAIDAARLRGEPFDVVLLDVQMPVLDGLETSRRLRARYPKRHERPWVVAMTANAMQGDRDECIAAGMDDYLSKPIRSSAVTDALRNAAANLGARPAATGTGAKPGAPGLLRNLDEGARVELLNLFAQEAPRLRGELLRALAGRAAGDVSIAAHTLAGTACYFDAASLEQVCRRIETAAEESDLQTVEVLVPQLDEAVATAVARAAAAA